MKTQAKKVALLEKAARAAIRLEAAVRAVQPDYPPLRTIDDVVAIRRQIQEAVEMERSSL